MAVEDHSVRELLSDCLAGATVESPDRCDHTLVVRTRRELVGAEEPRHIRLVDGTVEVLVLEPGKAARGDDGTDCRILVLRSRSAGTAELGALVVAGNDCANRRSVDERVIVERDIRRPTLE